MSKVWQIRPVMPAEFKEKFPEVNPVILQLLYNRGLDSQEKIDEFFNPDYESDIHDPFLFRDMTKAVKRIFTAIEQGEKIMIHGDYDADGVTSSAVMMTVLKKMTELFGQPEKTDERLGIYIPHREKEGYGLKVKTVETFAAAGVNLIITVDCGMASVAEVDLCQQKGMEVIITDHHQPQDKIPKAYAIINPHHPKEKYPFKYLSGVGVAFKVAQALIKEANIRQPDFNWEGFEKWLLDLVALGTVADVMPLLGENRTLVRYGLVVLNKTPRLGLQALFFKTGLGSRAPRGGAAKGIDTYTIAFQIGPRLNAAGRMAHANTAYGLLLADSKQAAEDFSDQIQQSNEARQGVTETITEEAAKEFTDQLKADEKLLIALGEGWPTGVLGLVAGKLCDRYSRPVFITSLFDGKIVGSGRSVAEFDVMEALLKLEKYFLNFGGHPAACGLTLKNNDDYQNFKKDLQQLAREKLRDKELTPVLEAEVKIDLAETTWALYDELEKMEPFGEDNPRPLFVLEQVEVDLVEKLGKDGSHLKILVKQSNGLIRKLIGFGLANGFGDLKRGDKIDVVVEVGVNEWNGNRELQLKVVDIKKSIVRSP